MLRWLAVELSGPLGGILRVLLLSGALVVVAVSAFGLKSCEVRSLAQQFAEASAEAATARQDSAELRVALDQQNAAVRQLSADCVKKEQAAAKAARAVLARARKVPPAGTGPEEMNRWLREQFLPRS